MNHNHNKWPGMKATDDLDTVEQNKTNSEKEKNKNSSEQHRVEPTPGKTNSRER